MAKRHTDRSKTKHRITKTERLLRETLNSTGMPYEIVTGTKHHKVILQGKLVGVFNGCTDRHGPRGLQNLETSIRRNAAAMQASA